MNLFWAVAGNMTAPARFESAHRFKTLPRSARPAARFVERQANFVGAEAESFPLREIGHDVSLTLFATPAALQTSAV
jgi:hypothetical protein